MSKNPTNKEIIDYFMSNIYESFSAYNAWKMIFLSKSKKVVSEEMAKRYVEIQKYHKDFFVTIEQSCLVHFVIMSLHSFDRRDDSYSLYKVNQKGTETFVKNNKKVIKALRDLRNKLFAHKDINKNNQYKIPSVISLDSFFRNLMEFYNKLTSKLYSSSTNFSNAESVKRDIELLFMNLYRGEAIRKREINIKWLWEKSNKKASDIL